MFQRLENPVIHAGLPSLFIMMKNFAGHFLITTSQEPRYDSIF